MAKSNADRQREYRERQKAQESQEPVPENGTGEIVQTAALEQALKDRDAYEDLGRRYGEDEADRRAETGQKRQDRISRAIGYQRWLRAEGRPPG